MNIKESEVSAASPYILDQPFRIPNYYDYSFSFEKLQEETADAKKRRNLSFEALGREA